MSLTANDYWVAFLSDEHQDDVRNSRRIPSISKLRSSVCYAPPGHVNGFTEKAEAILPSNVLDFMTVSALRILVITWTLIHVSMD